MGNTILKLYVKAKVILASLKNEDGQDLVEYALLIALISLAATAGMGTLATDINAAFTTIGGKLNSAV